MQADHSLVGWGVVSLVLECLVHLWDLCVAPNPVWIVLVGIEEHALLLELHIVVVAAVVVPVVVVAAVVVPVVVVAPAIYR